MKKLITILMAVIMLMSMCVSAFAADTATYEHITVGSPTQMKGDFFTDMWGNATSDIDMRLLLHGYDLITWDSGESMYRADPSVITGMTQTVDANGNHSYTISLAKDLYYSDGTQITAKDYAFSFLLQMAPEIEKIGGSPLRREHILGAGDYADGKTKVISGVKVQDDYTLVITLDGAYLPFFYEIGLLSCCPYPVSVIAPECEVKDEGEGVYLEGLFNAATLENTINGANGYRSHPSVVSGPYKLVSFDGGTAELEVNEFYKGNARGEKPKFKKITFTLADNETMIPKFREGEFQLLNKVTQYDAVFGGLHETAVGKAGGTAYPRVGLSYIAFCCEKDTVSSEAVRQAIAWCMDRDAVAYDYTGVYGQRVDGYYGLGQWMYRIVTGELDPEELPSQSEGANQNLNASMDNTQDINKTANEQEPAELPSQQKTTAAAWAGLNLDSLTKYTLDVNKAVSLLEADGWKLNAEGIREKDGVKLDLVMVYPKGNKIGEIFENRLVPNLAKAGIRLRLKGMAMPELLEEYYKQEARETDMIYLASNFDVLFDPSVHFQTKDDGEAYWASTNQNDEELYRLAVDMRQTEPGNKLEYVKKWIAFEEQFNKVLPMIPIYSNDYYDFYTNKLQNYDIAGEGSWARAIVGAKLAGVRE